MSIARRRIVFVTVRAGGDLFRLKTWATDDELARAAHPLEDGMKSILTEDGRLWMAEQMDANQQFHPDGYWKPLGQGGKKLYQQYARRLDIPSLNSAFQRDMQDLHELGQMLRRVQEEKRKEHEAKQIKR